MLMALSIGLWFVLLGTVLPGLGGARAPFRARRKDRRIIPPTVGRTGGRADRRTDGRPTIPSVHPPPWDTPTPADRSACGRCRVLFTFSYLWMTTITHTH